MTLDETRYEYRPYHTLAAFELGFQAYGKGEFHNPFEGNYLGAQVNAQAWDRGAECAMGWGRQRDQQAYATPNYQSAGATRKRQLTIRRLTD
jgi:hypothetical protein